MVLTYGSVHPKVGILVLHNTAKGAMPFCVECGSPVFPDAQFCTKCGAKVSVPSSNVFIFALVEDEADVNYSIDFFELELVGAARFEDSFVGILGTVPDHEEKELDDVTAVLLRESDDQDESDIVAVHVLDSNAIYREVGSFSLDDSDEYAQTIHEMERRTGCIVGCLARVRGQGKTTEYGRTIYSATVYLPEADKWLEWRL